MTTSDDTMNSLPTRQQVLAWQETYERLEREYEDMKLRHAAEEKTCRDQIGKIAKLVEYGLKLVDLGALPEGGQKIAQESKRPLAGQKSSTAKTHAANSTVHRPRKGGKSWTATIKRIVAKSEGGISYADLKSEVGETHLGETLKRTEKAFYGGISKLIDKQELVKHKGHLFTAPNYHKFMGAVKSGQVSDLVEPPAFGGRSSPNEIAVERYLATRPDGATTAEIFGDLLANPPSDLEVTKNRNSLYNLLKRQLANEKLVRKGDRYFLPDQKDETPDSVESSVSNVHHGNGGGAPLSTGGGKVVTFSSASNRPSANSAQSGE